MKSRLLAGICLDRYTCFKNKILACVVFSGILLLSLNSGNSAAAAVIFSDIRNHWAQADINIAVDAGYVKGYVDSTFRPDMPVSRAEFVSMLNSAFNVTVSGTGASYKDVKSSDWFAGNIEAAVQAGYMDIYAGDTFMPNQPLTRQEAAVLTSNLSKIRSGEKKDFKDGDEIEVWAQQQVYALVSAGILNGNPDGYFMPYAKITRAEAVALINRAKLYLDSTPLHASLTVTGSTVNIRSGPDVSYGIVSSANRGSELNAVLHSPNNWYKVILGEQSGWITGDYVTISDTAGRGGKVDRGGNADRGTNSDVGTVLPEKADSENGSDLPGQDGFENGSDLPGQDSTENGNDLSGQGSSAGGTDQEGQSDSTGTDGSNNGIDTSGEADRNIGGKLIVIDAGHGGYDNGATGLNGTLEKDINLAIALKLSDKLKEAGYKILLTRSDDTFISLKDRSAAANNANADIFVSIHCNVSLNHEAGGTEVLTEPVSSNPVYNQQEDSKRLAGLVQAELVKILGLKDRGVKDQELSVCRETNAPAILIETVFIDNSHEEELIKDTAVQDGVSAAIKQGIDGYFSKQ